MSPDEATAMLAPCQFGTAKSKWVDLGCGTGVFTLALAGLLAGGSEILAVDKDRISLNKIPSSFQKTLIQKVRLDFETDLVAEKDLDGILMANSLHFVKDKVSLLRNLRDHLKKNATLLLVEYDLSRGNAWVPYPLTYSAMNEKLLLAGFESVKKLAERPSAYNRAQMYSASAISS